MKIKVVVALIACSSMLFSCQSKEEDSTDSLVPNIEQEVVVEVEEPNHDTQQLDELLAELKMKKELDVSDYENRTPMEWGENVQGVKTQLDTDEQVIALTFDACGGPYGSLYDEELIDFLRKESIPATLFVNQRWIEENEVTFSELVEEPLFEIQNHGSEHVPLSVSGQSAWGIEGTQSAEQIVHEVIENQMTITSFTNEEPLFFRSGTAFYDEIAVEIVKELGLEVVNFNILGDAGATYSAEQVHDALLSSVSGSIVLLHMNQPNSGTAEGVERAVMDLKDQGFSFVTLSQYTLK
ncbi:polysaccharide deacetylase family protein [Alkalihalobacillus pseudalcaliphilus]|uniref:polysaccharide deacetylase family protein n=1 Tax=Alkalihalobacillus pseudalcaliphilus TaxID=79884 RepID=UPI00064DDDEC|nr:polysaccharide deacetylase family protein [Alkalihalobacillus pseudalcaliphilus]KMK75012.1 polysaccharide deacetylase [Alkalihalobacillus pseudalcaliphilus]